MATRINTNKTRKRKPTKRRATPARTRSRGRRRRFAPLLARALVVIVALVVCGFAAFNAATCQDANSKYEACEQWRPTVQEAAAKTKLGSEWADAILAAMYVESGGDTSVESVEGVTGDIMQAAEGAYGKIVKRGSEKYGVEAQTPEASIYAGCLEFKQNLKLWNGYLDGIQPEDSGKIQLVIQGYNFGADGWYRWCKKRGITSYSVELAQEYSDTQMPADAKGTPTHAQKWLRAYEHLRSEADAA